VWTTLLNIINLKVFEISPISYSIKTAEIKRWPVLLFTVIDVLLTNSMEQSSS
jgi:hypothetical protein